MNTPIFVFVGGACVSVDIVNRIYYLEVNVGEGSGYRCSYVVLEGLGLHNRNAERVAGRRVSLLSTISDRARWSHVLALLQVKTRRGRIKVK